MRHDVRGPTDKGYRMICTYKVDGRSKIADFFPCNSPNEFLEAMDFDSDSLLSPGSVLSDLDHLRQLSPDTPK